jgi:hypothetical protein
MDNHLNKAFESKLKESERHAKWNSPKRADSICAKVIV